MDSATASRLAEKYPLGILADEGDWKQIYAVKNNPELVIVVHKNNVAAGATAQTPGNGILAAEAACDVFRRIGDELPVAFLEQDSPNSFVAVKCRILKYRAIIQLTGRDGSLFFRVPKLRSCGSGCEEDMEFLSEARDIAARAFTMLKEEWEVGETAYVELKFGVNSDENLLVADIQVTRT